jgi:hypothetical protein
MMLNSNLFETIKNGNFGKFYIKLSLVLMQNRVS